MKSVTAGTCLGLLCVGIVWGQQPHAPARATRIAWVTDLATAQKLARAQKKLVLQFLMLGDLPDPHC